MTSHQNTALCVGQYIVFQVDSMDVSYSFENMVGEATEDYSDEVQNEKRA